MPEFIPKHDLKILNSVKNRAYHLDLLLNLCGLRIGWAGVIGLIPWIGDIIAFYFALQLVRKARTIDGGLPKGLEAEMMANVMFDFGIGLIQLLVTLSTSYISVIQEISYCWRSIWSRSIILLQIRFLRLTLLLQKLPLIIL